MDWLISIVPTVAIGIFMLYFERRMKKSDSISEERAAARKEECLLALDLQMSTAKMSYATAVALKRGYANGEVEEGIESFEGSKKKYFDFMNKQGIEHLAR